MSEPKISFSKAMVSGIILDDLVFPYPKMEKDEAENVAMIKDTFLKFAKDKLDPVKIDREAKIPSEAIDEMKELGFFGLIIPEKYGGFGLSSTAYTKMLGVVSSWDGSTSLTLGAHQSIGMKALLLFGNEKQKKKYLPKLATGEMVAAFCLTEPEAGSDAAGIKTRAVRDEQQKCYIMNGSKLWITNGGIADFFTVFAKEEITNKKGEKAEKISAFLVERAWEGVSVGKEEDKLGIKGSSTAAVFFEDVKIPFENVVGERGKGFKVAMEVLNSGRMGLAGGVLGALKTIYGITLEHISQRKQFRKTLSQFEAIKQKVAQIAIDLYAAESMVYLTTGLADRGDIDYSVESAMCKIVATDVCWRGVNECLQMAGGIGYMKEYPYERYLRDARINPIFEGTNEILRFFVALSGMHERGEYLRRIGGALRAPIKGFGLLTDFASDYVRSRITTGRIRHVHPALEHSKKQFENFAKDLHITAERVLMQHAGDIIYREMITTRLADALLDLYGMICCISRAELRITEVGIEKCRDEVRIVNTFCEQAWRRVRRNLLMVDKNSDQAMTEIADNISALKRFPYETE